MCGIFGYVGKRENGLELVVKGLQKLEYRGYDSWGVATTLNGELFVEKKVGKISEAKLEDFTDKKTSLAIGHTRWATHGGVTDINAHPHFSSDKKVAVVHNGIIENYEEIRDELGRENFISDTDTEVIPQLISKYLKEMGFKEAVKKAVTRLEGRYAIVAIAVGENLLIAARRGSPLIVGVGEDEYFLASDIPAFLEYTQNVNYLDDNEMVVLDGKVEFLNIDTSTPIKKRLVNIDWQAESADKGEYDHYMLKEIMEQKDSILRAINQETDDIMHIATQIKDSRGCFLSGCGTAGKVCMAAEYFFSIIADRHVNFAAASEFPIYHHFLKPESLLIVVSQSGETADVLEAMEAAKKAGAKVLSIVNVEGSTIARQSDFSLHIKAGPEKAVASTKAATSQMALFLLITTAMQGQLQEGRRILADVAGKINDMLNPRFLNYIKEVAEKIQEYENLYIIGKAENYPMALEAAIKIQEVSYVHAEGFASGELKHGPIALISEGTPCISMVANDEVKGDVINNTIELKARGAHIIGISPEKHEVFDEWIKVPDVGVASPLVNIIPVQLLAYYLGVLRGLDPDMPRNLAKSVTVK
ncbi:glutamine--fructose-6-phosphate transaminase (isomerizing) [Candidatus Peregrinibacteria bacterium]|nr:glutamine--fructose-6-phosphate transaminase (isomerizing) [Candidatus Peregrinibacteria bacterium]